MIAKPVVLFLAAMLLGCGSFSINQITRGQMVLRDGYFDGEFIRTRLIFKKFSWYREASLMYQVGLAKLSKDMPYFKWLSPIVQKDFDHCSQFYIALFYSQLSEPFYHNFVKEKFDQEGIELYLIPNFQRALAMHPQFKKGSLKSHQGRGLCIKDDRKSIFLKFSGYPPQDILE